MGEDVAPHPPGRSVWPPGDTRHSNPEVAFALAGGADDPGARCPVGAQLADWRPPPHRATRHLDPDPANLT